MRNAPIGTTVGVAVLLAIVWIQDAPAGEGLAAPVPDQMTIHGGVLKAVDTLHVETAFRSDGIDVYVYDLRGAPLSLGDASGEVHVDFQDAERPDIDASLKPGAPAVAQPSIEPPEVEAKGPAPEPAETKTNLQDRLSAAMDLTKLAEGEALAKLKLAGLPGGEIDLEVPFRMARVVTFTCAADGLTQATPGTCEKCGAPLLLVRSYYGCRRHPNVALDRDGSCWKDHDERLEIIVEPAVTLPGGSSMERDGVGRVEQGKPPIAGLRQR